METSVINILNAIALFVGYVIIFLFIVATIFIYWINNDNKKDEYNKYYIHIHE